MTLITAQDVNKLRTMTGAGMMDCKKALTEGEGNFEKAIEILRKKGQKISASRAGKDAKEGCIFVKVASDKQVAVLIALNCETDFVARTESFQNLGNQIVEIAFQKMPLTIDALLKEKSNMLNLGEQITDLVGKIGEKLEVSELVIMRGKTVIPYIHSGNKLGVLVSLNGENIKNIDEVGRDMGMQIAAMNPLAVDENSIDKTILSKEVDIAKAQILAEGKPADKVEEITKGKIKKFVKEHTLVNQSFVKDNTKTVAQYLATNGLSVIEFKRVIIG